MHMAVMSLKPAWHSWLPTVQPPPPYPTAAVFPHIFQASYALDCSWKVPYDGIPVGLCIMSFGSLSIKSTWHSRPNSNVFSSIRLLILHSSSLCIIPFLDTTLCLIKQESDQIFIARNQATIDNSKKVKWEREKSGKFIRTAMQYYETRHWDAWEGVELREISEQWSMNASVWEERGWSKIIQGVQFGW